MEVAGREEACAPMNGAGRGIGEVESHRKRWGVDSVGLDVLANPRYSFDRRRKKILTFPNKTKGVPSIAVSHDGARWRADVR